MNVLKKIPGAEHALNWLYSRVPMVGRGITSDEMMQRAGADEAIEVLERARLAKRGRGGHITLGQTLEHRIIQEAEGAAEAAFGGGPLLKSRRRGEVTILGELDHFVSELMERAPDDVMSVLEATMAGSGEMHKTYVRSAYRIVDEALESARGRTGGQRWWGDPTSGIPPGRIRPDLTEAFEEAEKWGILDPAIRQIEGGPSLIYDAMNKMGRHPTFEDAHLLQSAIRASGKKLDEIMVGRTEGFSKRMVKMINDAMDEAADEIPTQFSPVWTGVSRRSGAFAADEVATSTTTIRQLLDHARAISKLGKERFNESMIGPLMRAPSPEQFANAVTKGVRASETLRVTKQIIFEPRYRPVIEKMGKKAGISGFSPDDLWDSVRGTWIQDQMRRSTVNSIKGEVSGLSLHDKLVKNDVTRTMFPELFSVEEQGNVLETVRALGAIKEGTTGSAGANVIRLMQFTGFTGLFVPGVEQIPGGRSIPLLVVLGPPALARVFKNRSVVTTMNQGLGGKVAATGMGRFMIQFMRQLVENDIPFTTELSNGETYSHDPNKRKAEMQHRTSIPTP
jgi:hypothetical protein